MGICIAVVGRSGQLARALSEVSASAGLEIATLARPEFDLLDPGDIERAFDRLPVDIVVNAAAYTAVDRAESDEATAYGVNALGAERVAKACAGRGVPLIHVSTDYVFDGGSSVPYRESDPARPLSVYGKSKYEGEQRVAHACAQHIILRTAWLHSPFGDNFITAMLRLAQSHAKVSVVADQYGNPTYAPHLAQAILAVARHVVKPSAGSMGSVWGLYHATGAGEASRCELAIEVFRVSRALGGPGAVVSAIASADYLTPAPRPLNSRLDGSKLASAFGVRLPHWTIGVQDCLEQLLDLPSDSGVNS
jgi:dTDP-4-dehydrorhamnose reductase